MTTPHQQSEQLGRLKAMRDAGQITGDEYERYRAEVIRGAIQGPAPARPQPAYAAPPNPTPHAALLQPTYAAAPPQAPTPGPPVRRPRKVHPWRIAAAALGLLVVIVVIVAIANAGKSTNSNVAQSPATTPTGGTAARASAPKLAHVGDTIDVNGSVEDVHLAITLVKVAPTTRATDDFSTPQAGDRFYAAEFRIRNTGHSTYSDALDNDAQVADASGQAYDTAIVGSISAGPIFPTPTNITPGDTRLGWLVFNVPKFAVITQVQFISASGFGNGAQWIVP